jgi:hypothetical protein
VWADGGDAGGGGRSCSGSTGGEPDLVVRLRAALLPTQRKGSLRVRIK